ncbi:MAG: AraC family transcriptional regulator [Lachnospiraceae bacterium]
MCVYFDYPSSDVSSISVQYEAYKDVEEVPWHKHKHYEFTLINRGTCIHKFRGVEVPLIAGDLFLIPPDEAHAYVMHPDSALTNCYFSPERIEHLSEFMDKNQLRKQEIPSGVDDVRYQWERLLSSPIYPSIAQNASALTAPDHLSKQGVLHLPPAEAFDVEQLLSRIDTESDELQFETAYMKTAVLQMILIIFRRARNNFPQHTPHQVNRKKQLIINSMTYLERHYQEQITVQEMADASSLSESYFRSIFKHVTGLSPLNYLNRFRIIKSLEFIQEYDLPMSEIASMVGILDSNYFSRLFKKVMGCTPREFRPFA